MASFAFSLGVVALEGSLESASSHYFLLLLLAVALRIKPEELHFERGDGIPNLSSTRRAPFRFAEHILTCW